MLTGFLFSLSFFNYDIWYFLSIEDKKTYKKFIYNSLLCLLIAIINLFNNFNVYFMSAIIVFVLTLYQRYRMEEEIFEGVEVVSVTYKEKLKKKKGKNKQC